MPKATTKNRKKPGFFSRSGKNAGNGKKARRAKKRAPIHTRTRSGRAARRDTL